MLTLGQLINDEPWEIRRIYLWYMEVAKVGLETFIVKVPASTSTCPRMVKSS
jgi:hypothetical protein